MEPMVLLNMPFYLANILLFGNEFSTNLNSFILFDFVEPRQGDYLLFLFFFT